MTKRQKVYGHIDPWITFFPDHLIPEVLDMIMSAWVTFGRSRMKAQAGEHEVGITRRFRIFLIRYRNRQRLPLNIEREAVEDALFSGIELGRIDVKLRPGIYEHVYFALECKRLNVMRGGRRESLATEYVTQGMMRYVTSQYAAKLSQGGMIGYVMNGDVGTALTSVDRSVRNHYRKLCSNPSSGLEGSSHRPGDAHIKETHHNLHRRSFTLHHLFLPVTP